MASVQLRHIELQFGGFTVLDGLNLEVDSGDYVALLGENGCGKTTTLRVIAGLLTPSSGSVFLGGECVDSVPPRRRSVGMMLQGSSLYPHLTVRQNVEFGLLTKSKTAGSSVGSSPFVESSINSAIEIVDIGDLLDRFPHQLSGGQLRRVAIAKSIAGDPPIRLFDEPLSAIDSTTRAKLEQDLVHVHRTVGGTTIHVTHDPNEAMRFADKIAVMHAGRLLQYDLPETILNQPNSVQVADQIADSPVNWFKAHACDNSLCFEQPEVDAKGDWTCYLESFPNLPEKILIGIRPEHLRPAVSRQEKPRLCVCTADVTRRTVTRRTRGTTSSWVSSIGGQTFRATIANAQPDISPHEFDADLEDAMLFDAETGQAITQAVSR